MYLPKWQENMVYNIPYNYTKTPKSYSHLSMDDLDIPEVGGATGLGSRSEYSDLTREERMEIVRAELDSLKRSAFTSSKRGSPMSSISYGGGGMVSGAGRNVMASGAGHEYPIYQTNRRRKYTPMQSISGYHTMSKALKTLKRPRSPHSTQERYHIQFKAPAQRYEEKSDPIFGGAVVIEDVPSKKYKRSYEEPPISSLTTQQLLSGAFKKRTYVSQRKPTKRQSQYVSKKYTQSLQRQGGVPKKRKQGILMDLDDF